MEYKIFGCKVNKYYTDKWLNSEFLKGKKGIFIATCVVTDSAKRKWLKFVKNTANKLSTSSNSPLVIQNKENGKINKLSPTSNSPLAGVEHGNIYISGCGTFKNGIVQDDFYELYPELNYLKDRIILLGEDPEIPLSQPFPQMEKGVEQIKKGLEKLPKNIYTKKFVLIQGGCDSFCTFCLTVKKRGKHFSRSKEDILNEILEFEKKDGKEVVLTGINLSAWGLENTNDVGKTKFAELIGYILENTKIPRIRISSMGPEFINDDVLKLFENTRIYPHFHYSVQSGSNKILKAMGRHYDGKYIKNLLEKTRNIKRKDGIEISIGADIIVGFPGETKEDFKNTFDLIKDTKVSKLHAFPFSGHKIGENVTAGNFPNQINDKVKKERMFDIINLSDKIRKKFINNNVGKELEVLIEYFKMDKKNGRIKWKGWTQNYIEANESNFQILSGIIKRNNIIKGKLIK